MSLFTPLVRLSRPSSALHSQRIAALAASKRDQRQRRSYAEVVKPATQNKVGSKGPTAIVFMNMGGPSTTDEVGGFLSRLFVCGDLCQPDRIMLTEPRPTAI